MAKILLLVEELNRNYAATYDTEVEIVSREA